MTSLKNNQLVTININWNLSMASDFKKFEKEVGTVIPSCKVKDIKTIAVGIQFVCVIIKW